MTRNNVKILPCCCVLCGLDSDSIYGLCRYCESCLPFMGSFCNCCGLAFPAHSAENTLCGTCLLRPPNFNFCRSVFHYRTPVDALITEFKFRAGFSATHALIHFLSLEFISYYQATAHPQLLIPVPLHSQRIRERGFNQSLEIARAISRSTGIPVDHSLVVRRKNTAPQIQMKSARARKQNLRHAFSVRAEKCSDGASKVDIDNVKHIAVIDDVVTTTATISALSKCLTNAGIDRVDAWSVARVSR